MRFTRLRLNGFKSFVDPTDLVIHDGLTGIVGPNGCGKSNLLEALRWVMGENRPTAMRGAGMEDVVFAGSGMRRARAFAEVALTLDNAERLAPAGFNDTDLLEVSRRLTRDAGSAYRINGKEARARDVQMLFADASTGAHSPALVRQGQIAELINARPRARRRVLEEAAGISGLYQRRHEAELRLSATETNLARVGDTIESLAQQLATLNRQARQAARYREIGTALRRAEGMLLCRRLHEAEAASQAQQSALAEAAAAAARAEREARAATAAREEAEHALPPLREEEAIAGAVLQRLTVRREALDTEEARARQTMQERGARIEQLQRDAEREAALAADADDSVSRLEWEAAALEEAGEGHDARLAEAEAAATEAREAADEAEGQLAEATESLAELSARHQALEREAHEAGEARARIASAESAAREQATRAQTRLETAQAAQAQAEAEAEEAQETLDAAEEALAATEAARAEAEHAEAEARARRAEAEGAAGALAAEARALERLIAQEARAGTALLDAVRVAPGLEAALGAALGADLDLPQAPEGSGWRTLPALDNPPPLPEGAEPLSAHVQAPPELARRLSQLGLVSVADAPALHARLAPGQRLVTREGDLWRWDGLMQRGEDAPSAAALHLAQVNRLDKLRADLDEAQALAEEAAAQHDAHAEALASAVADDRAARDARRAAENRLSEARRALSRAEGEAGQAATSRAAAQAEAARLADEAVEAAERLAQAEAALAGLGDLAEARAGLETLRSAVEAARATLLARRSALDTCRRDGQARERRREEVAREIASWRARKDSAGERVRELENRADEARAALEDAAAAPEEIAAERETLAAEIARAEARRTAAAEALLEGERALRDAQAAERGAERGAGEAREARAAAQARADSALEAVRQAAAQIVEAHECNPDELMRKLDVSEGELPALEALETEIARQKRARDGLGAVNLRAEEDARTLGAEHEALVAERADLEAAVAKLRAGINALNREGRERLLAAFKRVNENFAALFSHLFGGGEARLVLVESDDPLEAGLEIMCQPPGKKLSTLSLLSGGEQTLTALALIFAVFLANPAPICVLDEVDAPLDDANVTRFCDLLDEMTRRTETRFLIITHNAITMARMDRLFGVTMAEQGVSQLVSVDLQRAEAMVA